MRCEKIGELLSPYLDQMTNEKESRCVETHIASCSKCRSTLEQLRKMCNAVHDLEAPEVPETFIKDLNKRLANENLKYFGHKHIKTPKKHGWIAAGVASVALAVGIYASSILPFGSMVANLQERMDKTKQPSSASVDNILDNIRGYLADKNDPATPEVNTKPETVDSGDKTGKDSKATKPGVTPSGPGKYVASSQPAISDVVSTSIKVADIGSSVQKVMAIAGENGGQYTSLPAPSGIQALSGNRTKAVSIKVDPENVDKVMNQITSLGAAATPEYNKNDVTSQVNEVQNNINNIQEQISKLEANPYKSETDKAKLSELNSQLFQYNQKIALLKRTIINIYLEEEGNQ